MECAKLTGTKTAGSQTIRLSRAHMNRRYHLISLLLIVPLMSFAACDDEDESDLADNSTDIGATEDVSTADADAEEDVVTIGEVGNPDQGDACDPHTLATAWPWNGSVSTGSVDVTESGGVFSATIDASAGGMDLSRSNPFVYLDLETGTRVDITDFEALQETDWDLAFKRVLIRTNSSDSGPGQVMLAKLSLTTFEAVTAAPDSAEAYYTDITLDEECELLIDPIGNPIAAINHLNMNNPSGSASWYNYDGGVSPNTGDIYIVRNDGDDTTYKLEILSWASGVFEIRWAAL